MEYVVIVFAILIVISFFLFSAALFFDRAIRLVKMTIRLKRKKIITKAALKRERRAIARLRRRKRIKEREMHETQKKEERVKISLRQRMSYLWKPMLPPDKKNE